MPEKTPKISVVGGGVAGLTAAYTRAKRGFAVEVLERQPGSALRDSGL